MNCDLRKNLSQVCTTVATRNDHSEDISFFLRRDCKGLQLLAAVVPDSQGQFGPANLDPQPGYTLYLEEHNMLIIFSTCKGGRERVGDLNTIFV